MQTISGERRQGRASHTRGFTGEVDDGGGERVSHSKRDARDVLHVLRRRSRANERRERERLGGNTHRRGKRAAGTIQTKMQINRKCRRGAK